MSERPYGEWAKKYRELGWLGTIPLPPGAKHPPPKGFTGSGRPHPTDHQVATWVKESPDGNLGLRLAEVPKKYLPKNLPVIYGGNNVDGWELVGIDMDNYKEKHGYDEMRELANELGELPATAICTARWGSGSGTAVYLVPKGYRFMGKASNGIDIIQKRHRFTIGYPSRNPDANDAMYKWMHGKPHNLKLPTAFKSFDEDWADESSGAGLRHIPSIAKDVAVLPVEWFQHLSRGGMVETDDPISDLSDDELYDWLKTLRYDDDMCDRMQRTLAKYIAELEESSSSHDKITKAHWELLRLAAEGHSGIGTALNEYHPLWWNHCAENRGGDPETAYGEINRSINGALDKTFPNWEGLGRPDDTCGVDHSKFDVDAWAERNEDERINAGDYGGLGRVVGRMEVLEAKPADEYGQHDDGNGQHFIDLYGANVKYVDGRDGWVVWDGERWHRDIDGRFVGLAYRRVRANQESYAKQLIAEGKENDDKSMIARGKAWFTWSRRSGNVGPIESALTSAIRLYVEEEPVAVKATIFDQRVDLLGCKNGVLELTDDPDVRPPRKDDYVTFNTGVEYVPWRSLANAEGETFEGWQMWLEYLDVFLPDKALQRYVQKVMGHLIIGENPEKRIVFLYGPHDTGKSTMIGAVAGALGDYYGTVDIALFKPKDLNPGLIRACPLRVTGMSEVDAGTMDASTVKRLTGNDKVMAEAKYSNEIFEGRPQFTTVIAANNPPNIRHADEALNERLLVLPFMRSIERTHRRYERQTQIEQHSGVAVLSWLVEGWKMYCAEGLDNAPAVVRKMQRDMVSGLNATQTFISEQLVKAIDTEDGRRALERAKRKADLKHRVMVPADLDLAWTPTVARVYELYVRWCNANGVDPVSRVELTKDIGLGKPFVRKVNQKAARCYYGARIKEMEAKTGDSGWKMK